VKARLDSDIPFKDKRGTWLVSVNVGKNEHIVVHQKCQASKPSLSTDAHEGDEFVFTWQLVITLSGDLSEMTSVSVNITDLQTQEWVSEERHAQIRSVILAAYPNAFHAFEPSSHSGSGDHDLDLDDPTDDTHVHGDSGDGGAVSTRAAAAEATQAGGVQACSEQSEKACDGESDHESQSESDQSESEESNDEESEGEKAPGAEKDALDTATPPVKENEGERASKRG
jgi:hypothetical protein